MSKVTIEIPDGFELVQISEGKWEQRKIERKPPKTWEEFCKTHPIQKKERFINGFSNICGEVLEQTRNEERDKNILPNERLAKAVLALCQLLQLRDSYNGSWIPEWTDIHECKYIIISFGYEIVGDESNCKSHPLSFKSEKLRDEFLKNFRDLIEIAKPLI